MYQELINEQEPSNEQDTSSESKTNKYELEFKDSANETIYLSELSNEMPLEMEYIFDEENETKIVVKRQGNTITIDTSHSNMTREQYNAFVEHTLTESSYFLEFLQQS